MRFGVTGDGHEMVRSNAPTFGPGADENADELFFTREDPKDDDIDTAIEDDDDDDDDDEDDAVVEAALVDDALVL
jgi:hypothetical protein